MPNCNDEEHEIESRGPVFSPPVYIQRYVTVREILKKEPNIQKVVDFGCSNGEFLKYLKNLPNVKEVVLVDTDASVINSAVPKARPLAWDYVFKRPTSLTVKLFVGDVSEPDICLQKFDAVTCIELIFASIQPKIAIVTTPNRDFNVLFPGLDGFRHWDHKFEWSQVQFQKWCHDIIQCYPNYTVEFDGVGDPPGDCKHLGYCTQIAVFRKINDKPTLHKFVTSGSYTLVQQEFYPGKDEESLKQEAM